MLCYLYTIILDNVLTLTLSFCVYPENATYTVYFSYSLELTLLLHLNLTCK